MIPKVKELKLISIYLYICDIYDSKLKNSCQRFSNNNEPEFTDQEVMTIYLFVMNVEQRLKIKQIHNFAMTIFVHGSLFFIRMKPSIWELIV
jgi:hypothetical protein